MKPIAIAVLFLSLAAGSACKSARKEAHPTVAPAPIAKTEGTVLAVHVPDGWRFERGGHENQLFGGETKVLHYEGDWEAHIFVIRLTPEMAAEVQGKVGDMQEACEDGSRPEVSRTPDVIKARCHKTVTRNERGDKEIAVEAGAFVRSSGAGTFNLMFIGGWPKRNDAAMSKDFDEVVAKTRLE